jgi:isoleucyl-tRNA synthetase
MYLEGSDQHRGWFQSSLLVALATRGRPPFREVLTHGFLIDLEGRKMSKSLGNVIAPQDVIKESGAEIIRLWVSMTEFTEELRVSKEILTRVVDVYRKLRNTCRILVANLYDFDPATDQIPVDKLDEVDRFALARYADAAQRTIRAYNEYDFSTVSQTLNTLATVDLSAFYVDVTKDRMYTLGAKSHERRSTQTAMYLISEGLARLLAPILPVTADELWRHIPGRRSESVHLEEFPKVEVFTDAPLLKTWGSLLGVREAVNARLEQKRKDKVIGTSLGARVVITASGPVGALLESRRDDLPMLFNVSEVALTVRLDRSTEPDPAADEVRVEVEKAPGVKCARCWRFVSSVRTDPDCAGICDRCVDALAGLVNC